MVKIISSRSLGKQPCYDIGLVKEHNFILENGLIASNCFNKSHSTAYAYITYQTAYLKANYPVEYMTALLTASSDSKEKVEKYRENCQKMNIDVKPPDINHSKKDFTPVGQSILFGLLAVANLGEGAIEAIIKNRAEGEFTSLGDFCRKIDLQLVNRRALETLIYAGAFDSLNGNRNQLLHDLEVIVPWAQKKAKDRDSGQMTIFDLQGDDQEKEQEKPPSAKPVEDFSLQDKLQLEKEHLGFYLSQHPLKAVKESLNIFSPQNLSDAAIEKNRTKISAVVIVTEVKKHMTKNGGQQMAFLSFEDPSGTMEGVVFPEVYNRLESCLEKDNHLMIWGRVDIRDDKVQLIVEDAEPIEQVKCVEVQLSPDEAVSDKQINLKAILQEHSGDRNRAKKVPVIAIVHNGKERYLVRLGEKFWVQDAAATVESLQNASFNATFKTLVS